MNEPHKKLIILNDFVYTNRAGMDVISVKKIKNAIIETGRICSDGRTLYLYQEGYFWENLRERANIRLRQTLFEPAAQAEIDKRTFEKIVADLIVDTRILIKSKELNNARFINFKNGLYDLLSKKFITEIVEETKHLRFSYILNAEYIEPAASFQQMPAFIKFIEETFQIKPQGIMFDYFLQNIGFLVSSVNNLRKAVVFVGAPA